MQDNGQRWLFMYIKLSTITEHKGAVLYLLHGIGFNLMNCGVEQIKILMWKYGAIMKWNLMQSKGVYILMCIFKHIVKLIMLIFYVLTTLIHLQSWLICLCLLLSTWESTASLPRVFLKCILPSYNKNRAARLQKRKILR